MKLRVFLILSFAVISVAVSAAELELSGSIESKLLYNQESKIMIDQERLNIVLEKAFVNTNFLGELSLKTAHNQDISAVLKNLYLDYYTDNMDWRFGKQVINWGSSYKINPGNYFTRLELDSLDSIDQAEGTKAIRGTYYLPDSKELTAAFVPFNGEGSGDLDDIQLGMKFTKRFFYGFDLSISLFSGNDNLAVFSPMIGFSYPEVKKCGFDIIGSISDAAVWSEIVYAEYKEKPFDNTLEATLGAEYKFKNQVNIIGQVYYRENRLPVEPIFKLITISSNGPVADFHKWDIAVLYDLEGEGLILKPEIQYSLDDTTWLNMGFIYTKDFSDKNSLLLSNIFDNIYTGITVDF